MDVDGQWRFLLGEEPFDRVRTRILELANGMTRWVGRDASDELGTYRVDGDRLIIDFEPSWRAPGSDGGDDRPVRSRLTLWIRNDSPLVLSGNHEFGTDLDTTNQDEDVYPDVISDPAFLAREGYWDEAAR